MARVVLEKSVTKRLLSTMFFAAAHFGSFTYFELILAKEANLSQSLLPGMFLLYGCTGFIGTFISEYLVKKLTARNTFRLSTVLLFTAILLMPLSAAGYPTVIALTMLRGLAYGLMPVSIKSGCMKRIKRTMSLLRQETFAYIRLQWPQDRLQEGLPLTTMVSLPLF